MSPVITKSADIENITNTTGEQGLGSSLLEGVVGVSVSLPSVACKISDLKPVIHTRTDSSIKTCLMNDDKFTVPTSLEASC